MRLPTPVVGVLLLVLTCVALVSLLMAPTKREKIANNIVRDLTPERVPDQNEIRVGSGTPLPAYHRGTLILGLSTPKYSPKATSRIYFIDATPNAGYRVVTRTPP